MPLPQLLEALLPPDLHRLCETGHCPSGTALFLTGDRPRWMFFVSEGEVVLERYGQDGQMACLQRSQSGFIGEASLTASRYHCDGRASVDAQVTRLPIKALREALRKDGDFAERWIAMLSRELRRLRLQNERLSLPKVQDRLLHLIETEGTGGRYQPSCSVKALAGQLAVTHEALYRAIAQSVAQGRVHRDGGALCLSAPTPGRSSREAA